jgi:hypothetical protein
MGAHLYLHVSYTTQNYTGYNRAALCPSIFILPYKHNSINYQMKFCEHSHWMHVLTICFTIYKYLFTYVKTCGTSNQLLCVGRTLNHNACNAQQLVTNVQSVIQHRMLTLLPARNPSIETE